MNGQFIRWGRQSHPGSREAEGAKIKLSLPSYLEQTKYLVSKGGYLEGLAVITVIMGMGSESDNRLVR